MMGLRRTILAFTLVFTGAILVNGAPRQDPAGRFSAHPPQGANAAGNLVELDVPGTQHWVDSGLDVRAGDQLVITVTGTLHYAAAKENGPEGLPRGWKDLVRNMPVNNAGRGAAIARIGEAESALPILVGASKELRATSSGHLFIGINQAGNDQAEGSYHVKIEVTKRADAARPQSGAAEPAKTTGSATTTGAAASQSATPLQSGVPTGSATPASATPAQEATSVQSVTLPAGVFGKIPRRIADKDGNPGDMVNFLILGSEEQMKQAFQSAGWVQVDRSVKEAALHGLLSSLSKEAYTNMPMSELFLFGRGQDFGFAHAEPIAVVASRHHLRVWKAPFAVDGQTLWVGAATHDIGFDRDQRNGGITHKIDPEIDNERTYVEQTLSQTGLFGSVSYATPPNALTEAKTATGGTFRSDGRVLVLILVNSTASRPGTP